MAFQGSEIRVSAHPSKKRLQRAARTRSSCSATGWTGTFLIPRYSIGEQSRFSGSEIPRRTERARGGGRVEKHSNGMPRICWHTILTCGNPQWYGKPLKQRGLLSRQGEHSSRDDPEVDAREEPKVRMRRASHSACGSGLPLVSGRNGAAITPTIKNRPTIVAALP